jgi:hypothetical protein
MSDLSRIIARIAEIEKAQAAFALELDELRVAQRVLARLGAQSDMQPASPKTPRAATTKALFVDILRDNPEPWMTANQVRERASFLKGSDIPMGTVSPTLTDLKNDGLVVRDGLKVALAERIKLNGASQAEAQEAPL